MAKNYQHHKDMLVGLAEAGINLAKANLPINKNWERLVDRDYTFITGPFKNNPKLSESLYRIKKICRRYGIN